MVNPKPNENVIAVKLPNAGRLLIHGWRKERWFLDTTHAVTDCGRLPEWRWRNWLWVEYRSLNPDLVVLCKKCWHG